MRDVIISKSLYHLNSIYNYDNDTFDRVKYGLEILYISITKTLIILGIAAMFGCFIDTLLFFLLITPLKTFSYGLHAKNSMYCYILSIIVFIIIPQIILNFNINFNIIIKIILSIFSLFSMIKFAPADTCKRPLINKKHRYKLKFISIIISLIYILFVFILENKYMCTLILLALVMQSIFINPFTYKIFRLPYANYKVYINDAATLQK